MDNYYNTFDLFKELLDQKTDTTSTLKAKRKNTRCEFVETKLVHEEVTCYYTDGVFIEHVLDLEECKNKQDETTMKPTANVKNMKWDIVKIR
ncbi:hypothetical protein J6590_056185 [Homalodisca vitripennis]|nr:hypothetical protein J6590_056185 [Homalodisca vitripennis]